MKRKFTKKYLENNGTIYNTFDVFSNCSCWVIKDEYPQYQVHYSKMLRKQFKINPGKDTLYEIKGFPSNAEIALLRVLLLMSFEDAILNGEIK